MFLLICCNNFNQKIYKAFTNLLWLAVVINIAACNEKKPGRKIERSFYYWKSVFRINAFEKKQLDQLAIKTLYVKFFDVDWDETTQLAVPEAKLQSSVNPVTNNFRIIPTVFITNNAIQKTGIPQIGDLSNNICSLIQQIKLSNRFDTIIEIQIDCDWTASTKEKYFDLLKKIRAKWQDSHIPVSATIRLHQIKFISKTGIPPVDKGLLMCYNMGNMKDPATKNSILTADELKKYTGNLPAYPLPLDIALPLFNWKVLFRHNQFVGLIQDLPDTVFSNSFCLKNENRYQLLKDTTIQGYYFMKGDMIRNEESNYNEIIATAKEINKLLKNSSPRVALYHLDAVLLKKYSTHELENIYNSLR